MMSTFLRHAALVSFLPVAILSASALGCVGATDSLDDTDEDTTSSFDDALTSTQKKAVSDHIKSVAKKRGVTNPLLFAGVPNHESGLVQCWKDATWACKGPHSDYCGGPVIAGSGDGPCSEKQGGLGMYQLDAGTYSQTLASYGSDVVELDPQIDGGVDIIISKVWHCPNTPHFDNEKEVITWINGAKPGTDKYETFLTSMAWCYNGSPPGSSRHELMRSNYNKGIKSLLDAFGHDYWYPSAVPTPTPTNPTACGLVKGGQGLTTGESHSSCNGKYKLSMLADGNLALYHNGVGAIWSTHTKGDGGHTATMQKDGNFVLYNATSKALWSSASSGHEGAHLSIQDDGNLVVYGTSNKVLWASHTNGK